jgi:hypothetical protein
MKRFGRSLVVWEQDIMLRGRERERERETEERKYGNRGTYKFF